MRQPNLNEEVLLNMLGVEQTELKRHSKTVYEWRGIYFEVLTTEQMKRGKVPASWYMNYITPWRQEFKIREMGKQATKVKKILKKETI